jgi:hypothetical protein
VRPARQQKPGHRYLDLVGPASPYAETFQSTLIDLDAPVNTGERGAITLG